MIEISFVGGTLGRLAYNGEKMKVKILTGALSYPRPLAPPQAFAGYNSKFK